MFSIFIFITINQVISWKKHFFFRTTFRISPFIFGWHLGCTKWVSNSKSSPVKVLLSFCLVFCQFEAGLAYKSVGYEKNVWMFRAYGGRFVIIVIIISFILLLLSLVSLLQNYFNVNFLIQTSKCCNIVFVGIWSYAFSLFIFTEENRFPLKFFIPLSPSKKPGSAPKLFLQLLQLNSIP